MHTIDKILSKAYNKDGAQRGRPDIGDRPKIKRVYSCEVKLNKEGYDKGGAYWGTGSILRVDYTKDLKYIKFYRMP